MSRCLVSEKKITIVIVFCLTSHKRARGGGGVTAPLSTKPFVVEVVERFVVVAVVVAVKR